MPRQIVVLYRSLLEKYMLIVIMLSVTSLFKIHDGKLPYAHGILKLLLSVGMFFENPIRTLTCGYSRFDIGNGLFDT